MGIHFGKEQFFNWKFFGEKESMEGFDFKHDKGHFSWDKSRRNFKFAAQTQNRKIFIEKTVARESVF